MQASQWDDIDGVVRVVVVVMVVVGDDVPSGALDIGVDIVTPSLDVVTGLEAC